MSFTSVTITLTANGADTYVWSEGSSGGSIDVAPTLTTIYTVTGTIAGGCSDSISSVIIINPAPSVDPGPDVTVLVSTPHQLFVADGYTYVWKPAEGLSCTNCSSPVATPTVNTTYCVRSTDASNCADSACVTLTVIKPCPRNETLQVPNAFSPNGDGANDVLILKGWEECVVEFSFIVFDRWGEIVFETDNPLIGWDGTFKGKELDPAVFVYFVEATFTENNETVNQKGNISLIR